ncbi:hypothetical protein Syun_010266 [Stephania yunnanensis]|uniref:Uncharacterized protein n=1 Tax=Stephania yunnanensis TaxID=152371 RepID=A0AAP0PPU3_9MAGN
MVFTNHFHPPNPFLPPSKPIFTSLQTIFIFTANPPPPPETRRRHRRRPAAPPLHRLCTVAAEVAREPCVAALKARSPAPPRPTPDPPPLLPPDPPLPRQAVAAAGWTPLSHR